MTVYQVLARKYRPQRFAEVVGQDAIVTTLKNAIKFNRLAHAYLFCGSKGTGKTTLARVFAKALNCQHPTPEGEPCNQCSSCKEITAGTSLDVLEIDGASHRGIDDIRQINETVAYSSASGKYKIYIIDEVHMLTKEAFNALLKTLEEPPLKVKFFFATTEPHKVLPTILSRCQRFNLNRIPLLQIINKLNEISKDLDISISEEALRLIALRADGGLRDAESLLDQIISFHEGEITAESVASVLGIMPREILFDFDRAGKEGNLAIAFEMTHQLFSEGKDLIHFMESLADHFRTILMVKVSGKTAPFLILSDKEREQYETSAKFYRQEQCIEILDFLIEAQNQIRFSTSTRVALETVLLRIIRSHQKIPVELLVKKLAELEQLLGSEQRFRTENLTKEPPKSIETPMPLTPAYTPPLSAPPLLKATVASTLSITEDPTPSNSDLGIKEKKSPKPKEKPIAKSIEGISSVENPPTPAVELGARLTEEAKKIDLKTQSRYDTILQFTAVELEGVIQKKSFNR